MDAVNWLVHGKHGDQPECACPVIGAYVIRGNDAMPDDVRQRLIAYLPRIAGSRSADHEAARLRVMVMAAVRVFAPHALDAAGLHDHAATLRAAWAAWAAWAADAAAEVAEAEAAVARLARAEAAAAWAADAADAARAADAERAADAAAETAARAARAREEAWDDYSAVLDAALSAGPQGGP
jgi:hypothetical protein